MNRCDSGDSEKNEKSPGDAAPLRQVHCEAPKAENPRTSGQSSHLLTSVSSVPSYIYWNNGSSTILVSISTCNGCIHHVCSPNFVSDCFIRPSLLRRLRRSDSFSLCCTALVYWLLETCTLLCVPMKRLTPSPPSMRSVSVGAIKSSNRLALTVSVPFLAFFALHSLAWMVKWLCLYDRRYDKCFGPYLCSR